MKLLLVWPEVAPSVLVPGVEPLCTLAWVPTGKVRPLAYHSVGAGFVSFCWRWIRQRRAKILGSSAKRRCSVPPPPQTCTGVLHRLVGLSITSDNAVTNLHKTAQPLAVSTFFTFRRRTLVGRGCQKLCDFRPKLELI